MRTILIVLLLTGTCQAGTYIVKQGDTLGGISQRLLGRASLWPQIAMANKLKNPNLIRVGQKLTIPTKAPSTEMVWARIRMACPDCRQCGTNGITATGANARLCNSVASVPWILPYGTWVKIPDYGWKVANDTGGVTRREWRRKGILQVEIYRDVSHWKNWLWGHKDMFVEVRR